MNTRRRPRHAALTAALITPIAATALLLTACGGDEPSMTQAQACDFLNEFYYDHIYNFDSDGEQSLAEHLSKDLNTDYKTAVATLRKADEEDLRDRAKKMPTTTEDIVDDDLNYTVESAVDRCPSLSDPHYGSKSGAY